LWAGVLDVTRLLLLETLTYWTVIKELLETVKKPKKREVTLRVKCYLRYGKYLKHYLI
jgi:hypothetical protein